MKDKDEYIAEFKANQPIRDCLGSTGGRWKWRRVSDCIDLRYGHDTRQGAVYWRHQAAIEAYGLFLYHNEMVPCRCGGLARRQDIDEIGECWECYGRREEAREEALFAATLGRED